MTGKRSIVRLLAIGSALGAVAGVAATAGSGSTAKPGWQELGGLELGHGRALTTASWASGRAWFVVSSARRVGVASGRIRGGRLASVVTTHFGAAASTWYPIANDAQLLYPTSRTASGIAALLATGKVAEPQAAAPEPLESEAGAPVAAARIGGRIVWALAGGRQVTPTSLSYKPTLGVCCAENGAAQNLTALITARVASPPRGHALGVDGDGRLWLAWFDGPVGRAEARVVELDPSTLAPKTRKALVAPVERVAGPGINTQKLQLVCATTCRLVLSSFYPLRTGGGGIRISTWAPGERSATPVELDPDRANHHLHPRLIAAGQHAGRLAIAYAQGSADYGLILKVVVANARGAGAREVGAVQMPARYRGFPMALFFAGRFTPGGFVYAQTYSNYGRGGHIIATVVPLR